MSFAELLAGAISTDAGFALTIPQDWHQGRTAYGGFSAALLLSAARKVGGDALPPLRSVTVNFIGPAYGAVEVRAKPMRSGRNATWIAAEMVRDGEVACTATFLFMQAVNSPLQFNHAGAPEGFIPVNEAREVRYSGAFPTFMQNHFEARFALPPEGEVKPEITRWVRLKERAGLDPTQEMLLIADTLPPGVMAMRKTRVPTSTTTWLYNMIDPAPVTRDGWWLLRSVSAYAEKGSSNQTMQAWNADGAPVSSGMQSVALFG